MSDILFFLSIDQQGIILLQLLVPDDTAGTKAETKGNLPSSFIYLLLFFETD